MASKMKENMKDDIAQDKALIKKAFKQYDSQERKGGKGTPLKLKKGGPTSMDRMKYGSGMAKAMNQGGMAKGGMAKGKSRGRG